MPLMRFSGLYANQLRPFALWVLAGGALVVAVAAWLAYRAGRRGLAAMTAIVAVVIATEAPQWAPGMVSMLVSVTLVALGVFRFLPESTRGNAQMGTRTPPN